MLSVLRRVSTTVIAALGTCAASGVSQSNHEEISAALVAELLDTLDPDATARLTLPADAPDRREWRRDPSPRPGLALLDMTPPQRVLVERLLATVLSDWGRLAVAGIRSEQDLLGRGETGMGAQHYWLALYGTPGAGAWAWRFGGHHVSVHAAYAGASSCRSVP